VSLVATKGAHQGVVEHDIFAKGLQMGGRGRMVLDKHPVPGKTLNAKKVCSFGYDWIPTMSVDRPGWQNDMINMRQRIRRQRLAHAFFIARDYVTALFL
jgi:hypothetical protein